VVLTGQLEKMETSLSPDIVEYHLSLSGQRISLNPMLGQQITLDYHGVIHCIACGCETAKSFNQGYCFPCVRSLARCDICLVRPEQCHFHLGSCREPEWGEKNCFRKHHVYLANSSGVKVGITRSGQIPARWLDQGAVQAVPILAAGNRRIAGLVEVVLKQHVSDRTNWRKMLQGQPEAIDLADFRDKLLKQCRDDIEALRGRYGKDSLKPETDATVTEIRFPVQAYPGKVVSLSLDKTPSVSGVLLGMKGQYLILDKGVLNVRKFTGYQVSFSSQSY